MTEENTGDESPVASEARVEETPDEAPVEEELVVAKIDWTKEPLALYANQVSIVADSQNGIFAIVFGEVGPSQRGIENPSTNLTSRPVASLRLPAAVAIQAALAMLKTWNSMARSRGLPLVNYEMVGGE